MDNPRPLWLRPTLLAVTYLATGALIVLQVWMLVTVYQVTGKIRETQQATGAVLAYIDDCTKTTGDCYQKSEARDAAQVGKINAATVAAAYCAVNGQMNTYAQATRCVRRLINGKDER